MAVIIRLCLSRNDFHPASFMQMKDLEAQLELAQTDTVADKLKDAEDELRVLRSELADVR